MESQAQSSRRYIALGRSKFAVASHEYPYIVGVGQDRDAVLEAAELSVLGLFSVVTVHECSDAAYRYAASLLEERPLVIDEAGFVRLAVEGRDADQRLVELVRRRRGEMGGAVDVDIDDL